MTEQRPNSLSQQPYPHAEREHCPCPLCGADAPEATPYAEQGFAVLRCGACRVWYLSPRLPEAAMAEAYRSGSYFGGDGAGYDDYGKQELSLQATFRRLAAALDRAGLAGGRLLEVGCGFGFFLQEAAPYFAWRGGTEFSPPAAERARAAADRVWDGGIDVVPADETFDCIVALHVIEHVYNPAAFMEKLLRHMRPGGRCILAAPDMGGFWRRLMGRRWPSFKYPEHVVFYDSASLQGLMRSAGLSGITPLPYPHAFPLGQICRKLHLPCPEPLDRLSVWLPGTTVAAAGVRGAGTTR